MDEVSSRVSRRLVHRASDAEVFVTGFAAEGPEGWQCAVHVPSTHSRLTGQRYGLLPIIVALEVQRQCGYVAAHQRGVPFGWRFVILELAVQWIGTGPGVNDTGFSGQMRVETSVTQWWQQKPRRIEYVFSLIDSDGDVVGSGHGVALCLEPTRYAMLRRRPIASPENTRALHTTTPSPSPIQWDHHDRFLFNKPDDHVVSMALIDHFLNSIPERSMRATTGITTRFYRFGESSRPIHLHISTTNEEGIEGLFVQDNHLIAQMTATSH